MFDFENTPIEKDTNLIAQWGGDCAGFSVEFDLDGGTSEVPILTQFVPAGQTATMPTATPTKDGCGFIGWYETTEEDPDPQPEPGAGGTVNVMFRVDGGSPQPAGQEIVAGTIAQYPGAVEKEGCEFLGWYLAGEMPDELVSYLVTFDTDGGNDILPISVWSGQTVEIANPTKEGFDFNGWTLNGEPFNLDTPITDDITLVASWEDTSLYIEMQVISMTESSRLTVNSHWGTSSSVYIKNMNTGETIARGQGELRVSIGDVVRLYEKTPGAFRRHSPIAQPLAQLVDDNGKAEGEVIITKIPSMDNFTTDEEGTIAPNNFFYSFNNEGSIVSLPEGSFDISKITQCGGSFFSGFNSYGQLKSLPTGSFILSEDLSAVDSNFFSFFNIEGQLNALPTNSFNISNINSVKDSFFCSFNEGGELVGLPEYSFQFSSNLTKADMDFFKDFNNKGKLVSLPNGSFDTSHISIVGDNYFSNFNYSGLLTSLPAGSFKISSNLTVCGDGFFSGFNAFTKSVGGSSLQILPVGSFDTSSIVQVGAQFFSLFNYNGSLSELPTGSFNLSNIIEENGYFLQGFNNGGNLLSLPDDSFNFSKITSASNGFCRNFNYRGMLISLPSNSFDISNITAVGNNFFYGFNTSGGLTSLPLGSFDTENIASWGTGFMGGFNNNGSLVKGNGLVKIYAPTEIVNFDIDEQVNIEAGSYIYVNGI